MPYYRKKPYYKKSYRKPYYKKFKKTMAMASAVKNKYV